jgi:hypothetical protein
VRAFVQMMRSWEGKVLYVERPEEGVPPQGGEASVGPAPGPTTEAAAVPSPTHIESIEVTPVVGAVAPLETDATPAAAGADAGVIAIDDDAAATAEDIAALTEGADEEDGVSLE